MENNLRKQTTVYITDEIRKEIQLRGMTVSGAFLAGWDAIQNQIKYAARIEELEEDSRDMRKNLATYERMVQDLLKARP